MDEETEVGPNVAAVKRDLAAIARRDKDLSTSGLAQMALTLAAGLDNAKNSLTSMAMASKTLAECLSELHALAPAEKTNDGVTKLADKRAERLARKAAAEG